jgi:hypothetical protein
LPDFCVKDSTLLRNIPEPKIFLVEFQDDDPTYVFYLLLYRLHQSNLKLFFCDFSSCFILADTDVIKTGLISSFYVSVLFQGNNFILGQHFYLHFVFVLARILFDVGESQ